MTNTERADQLFEAAQTVHAAAYEAAKSIPDAERRQAAFREADRVYDLQREYQRKVRFGEAK